MKESTFFSLKNKRLSVFSAAATWAFVGFLSVVGHALAQANPAPDAPSSTSASALLDKHTQLKPQLAQNMYRRPLVFESTETADTIGSAVYAVLDAPFPTISMTFGKPDQWCEVLILHLNTKYCRTHTTPALAGKITVNVGKKTPQPLSETFLLAFSHRVSTATQNYFSVELYADKGPLNTTDYQLQLSAVPLPGGKTFINLRYAYGYGFAGRLAMQTYLSTLGRGKVGFTRAPNNEAVGGMRGAVERNTMRYYLAVEAYLASLKQPPGQQVDARLQYWFDATEEYALQLHELDLSSYLAMKKDEYQRQQRLAVTD